MGEPIEILELAKKMTFLSGRSIQKYINKKYSGLNKEEKIVEELINKNEIIKNIDQNNILEITQKKDFQKNFKFKNILEVISRNDDNFADKYLKKIAQELNK